MNKTKNEAGITLVELLAVLVLASLVITVIWTIIMTSIRYGTLEMKKLKMQQEANYIVTRIQQIHRQQECYEIWMPSPNVIDIKQCESQDKYTTITSKEFEFTLSGDVKISTIDDINPIYSKAVIGKVGMDDAITSYKMDIKLNDPSNDRLTLSVPSVISRYSLKGIE